MLLLLLLLLLMLLCFCVIHTAKHEISGVFGV